MATNQPSLFGAFPWADGSTSSPTLYGSGYIPQTFSVTLSEIVAGSEAEIFSTAKVLADSLALSETRAIMLARLLADSITPSDAVVKVAAKIFNESASISESKVIFTIKDLSDFLILKEWISINLKKAAVWNTAAPAVSGWAVVPVAPAGIWTNPEQNANVFDSLWGKYQYGRVLFGGLKPLASWSRGTASRRPSVWTNENGHKENY